MISFKLLGRLRVQQNQDKKYCIYFEEIAEQILKNVPEQNKKYVQKQLNQLDKNFMDYLYYWNEKYYRNGFVDVIELLYLYGRNKSNNKKYKWIK